MKKIILLLLTLFSFDSYSQYGSFLNFHANPLMVNLINPNKRSISTNIENAATNFKIPLYMEYGVSYCFQFKNKISIGVGAYYKRKKFISNYQLKDDLGTQSEYIITEENWTMYTHSISIQPKIGITLFDRIQITGSVFWYSPIKTKIEGQELSKLSFNSTAGYQVNEKLYFGDGLFKSSLVPDINFGIKIYKGLIANIGAKLKFWKNDIYTLVNVEGYFNNSGNPDDLIFRSQFYNYETTLYFGLTYEVQLNKNLR